MDRDLPGLDQIVSALLVHYGTTLIRHEDVHRLFANSPRLVSDCVKAGWLKPVIRGIRLTCYTTTAVAHCLRRIARQGRPRVQSGQRDGQDA